MGPGPGPGALHLVVAVMGPAAGGQGLGLVMAFIGAVLALGGALIFFTRLVRRDRAVASTPPVPIDVESLLADVPPQPEAASASPPVPEVTRMPIDEEAPMIDAAADATIEPPPLPLDALPPGTAERTRGELLETAEKLADDGSFTAAAACYREAGDPHSAARCYHKAGDVLRVVECLEEAGDHYRLGRIFARRGDRQRAASSFERVEKTHPKYTKALLLLARMAYESGEIDRSVELVRSFLSLQADAALAREGRKLLGKLLEMQGSFLEATDVLEQLHEDDPHDAAVERRLRRVRRKVEERVRSIDAPIGHDDSGEALPDATGIEHDILSSHDQATDRYELFEKVGQGATGRVYKGYDHIRGTLTAVKFLDSWGSASPAAREAFHASAKRLRPLTHRNLVTIRDIGELEGHPFVATDYVIGRSLDRCLSPGEPAPRRLLLAVAVQLGGLLDHLHQLGIVHGDIKPTNLLVRDEPENALVLTDLGLAQALREADPGALSSDPWEAYRAPEVGGPLTAEADIFSLGVLLYRMLTGALPFSGRASQADMPPTPPWAVSPLVDQEVGRAVLRCLEWRPELRPQEAGEVTGLVRTRFISAV